MCLNTGTPKNINFSFETNGKLMALGVPILKHFRVIQTKLTANKVDSDKTASHGKSDQNLYGQRVVSRVRYC